MTEKWLNNRYELLEKIGEGGMAEVYKAKDHKLNRFNAIKILKNTFVSDDVFITRFKREAENVANLNHNNIISVMDVGNENNINYIVMEYVKGKNLKEIITENKKLNVNVVVDCGIQIAKALEHASSKGIVHRDVKPQNILVSENGDVKVTDFGISKSATTQTITQTGKVMGSAHYISPEQARGNDVDFRTDIYSFGILLYEMVTGSVPFDADTPVTIAIKQIQEKPMPPIMLDKSIPESLNNLILKCIEKEPDDRYQSFSEIIIDLRAIKNNKKTFIQLDTSDKTMVLNDSIQKTRKIENNVNNNYKYEKKLPKSEDKPFKDNDEKSFKSDEMPYKSEKKSSFTKIIMIVLTIIIFTGVGGFVLWNYVFASNDELMEIPVLIGTQKEEAINQLNDLGLQNKIVEVKSNKAEGEVLEVSPKAGQKVEKNSTVTLKVSEGERVKVQGVNGKKYDDAYNILTNLGLKVTKEEQFSDDKEEGIVISQSPKADSEVRAGETVKLVVSKGKEVKNTKMPNLYNLTVEEATKAIEESKLVLKEAISKETTNDNNKEMDGKVYKQSAEPGTDIQEGAEITIEYYTYTGSDNVKLPTYTYIGMTYQEVFDSLGSLGDNFTVYQTYVGTENSRYSEIVESIKVNGEAYIPGSEIPKDSKFTIKTRLAGGESSSSSSSSSTLDSSSSSNNFNSSKSSN